MGKTACKTLLAVPVLVFALTSSGPTATALAPAAEAPLSQPNTVLTSERPAIVNKARSEKQVRLRQIVLLWLLAAHPAR
jgi:hypothetical protein